MYPCVTPDFVVGTPTFLNSSRGLASLYRGGATLNGNYDGAFEGELIDDYFGVSVPAAGDVNNDGYDRWRREPVS